MCLARKSTPKSPAKFKIILNITVAKRHPLGFSVTQKAVLFSAKAAKDRRTVCRFQCALAVFCLQSLNVLLKLFHCGAKTSLSNEAPHKLVQQ